MESDSSLTKVCSKCGGDTIIITLGDDGIWWEICENPACKYIKEVEYEADPDLDNDYGGSVVVE